MEQLINTMPANAQAAQMIPAAKKGESSQKDGFQKLLEQKQGSTDAASNTTKPERPETAQKAQDTQKTPKTEDVQDPQEVQALPKSEKELEDQMALAAMALLRNPLVADIAEETPQILTDPNWQDGLVPVGYDDYAEQGIRIVHWMQPEGESGENLDAMNDLAGDLAEELNDAETVAEAPADVTEIVEENKTSQAEVKVETGTVFQEGENEDTPEPQDADVETPVFEDVKAVPVKVGDPPRAEKAERPVEDQIAPKVREALQNGETRVELQLTPENLGKITVEMTQGKDGDLVVQIHAENRETQSLLNRSSANLAELLGRETGQEVRVEVPRQEESQRQDLYEQQQEQQRRHQQEQRRKRETGGEDFLQQLRLGLIPLDGE